MSTKPTEDLSYLCDPAYVELIREMEQAARRREARRANGTWTEQERRDYEFMSSLNSGLGDADLT